MNKVTLNAMRPAILSKHTLLCWKTSAPLSSTYVASWAGIVACLLSFGLGCAPSLNQAKPREANRVVPSRYAASSDSANATSTKAGNVAQKTWNEFFVDPHLRALVDIALANNQELNIQLQEIIIAQNEVMARQGEYLPKVGVGGGAGIDKVGKFTSQGASDEANGVPNPLQNYSFGFSASWEVDIWKKLRNAAKSAAYQYLATVEGKNFMVTRLVAEIAKSYYELIALDNQLDVLRRNIAIQQYALEVVKLQKQAARVTELAVQRFQAEVLKNQSKQFEIEQKIVLAENRINFLVGRFPQPVARNSQKFDEPLPNVIDVGIPSQLLDNRPDVRQAELQLEAAKLDVQVAKAGFYPSLTIDAGAGYQAFNAKHLLNTPGSLFLGVAGNLMAPLLNRQAIKAQYFSANAQQIQAVLNYERTLLQAFTDVANQLAMIRNLKNSFQLRKQQVDILSRSIEVSNILFQSARADYMEVLLTRRDALESQMELIDTRLQQMNAKVNVYQALGGGWK